MRHKKFSSVGNILDPKKLYKTKRKIKSIIVHCTATRPSVSYGAKRCDRDHERRWSRPGRPSGIGYHYVVRRNGTLEKGRWVDYMGAHTRGHNKDSIGTTYEGGLDHNGYEQKQGMTARQERTMVATLKTLRKLYNVDIKNIKGHNEHPHVNKACPCTPMNILRDRLKECS
jgi:N-acetylmuramoyl-L-alanine amidase